MAAVPISPRPGTKLTPAVNIPNKVKHASGPIVVPSPPHHHDHQFRTSSPMTGTSPTSHRVDHHRANHHGHHYHELSQESTSFPMDGEHPHPPTNSSHHPHPTPSHHHASSPHHHTPPQHHPSPHHTPPAPHPSISPRLPTSLHHPTCSSPHPPNSSRPVTPDTRGPHLTGRFQSPVGSPEQPKISSPHPPTVTSPRGRGKEIHSAPVVIPDGTRIVHQQTSPRGGVSHHSPVGSPDRTAARMTQRRHTISVANPSLHLAPLQLHRSHPANLFPMQEKVEEEDEKVDEVEDALSELQRIPLPMSSSSFQKVMQDLEKKSTGGYTSSDDEGGHSQTTTSTKRGTTSEHDVDDDRVHPPATPVIEISEATKYSDYSLDIELPSPEADDENGGIELSRSAPGKTSGFHAMTKTGKRHHGRLGSADFARRYSITQESDGDKEKGRPRSGNRTLNDRSPERPSSRLGRERPTSRLGVPNSPRGSRETSTRKLRSTDGSLPALHLPHHMSHDLQHHSVHHHSVHSPFISSPLLSRKMSLPAGMGAGVPHTRRRRASFSSDLRSLSEDAEREGSSRNSKSSVTSHSSKNGSASDSSPSPSPSPPARRSSRSYNQEYISPLSLKTANQITKFITAAAASSTVPGGNRNRHLLPGNVSLPPVCNTSGRLLVHRSRDDSMRLVKQAVNLENNIPVDAVHHHVDDDQAPTSTRPKSQNDHHNNHHHHRDRRTSKVKSPGHKSLLGFHEA